MLQRPIAKNSFCILPRRSTSYILRRWDAAETDRQEFLLYSPAKKHELYPPTLGCCRDRSPRIPSVFSREEARVISSDVGMLQRPIAKNSFCILPRRSTSYILR